MRVAYFDCPMGVSGDMILGALIDAGREPVPPAPRRHLPPRHPPALAGGAGGSAVHLHRAADAVQVAGQVSKQGGAGSGGTGVRAGPVGERLAQALAGLNLPGYALRWERVMKGPFAATQVTVEIDDTTTERHLADVEALLEAADIPDDVRQDAQAVFRRLAAVEAAIHGSTPDQVHFHELGAIDTLVDVVGALWGLKLLGVDKVFASPLPAARGWVQSMHGPLPLPAPATLALLRGVLLSPAPVEGELVTPTGAALLTHLAEAFGPPPAMTLRAIGYGAGRKDFSSPEQGASSHPNVLRLWLGEVEDETPPERMVLLETNIDDMNPQLYEHVAEQLFDAGALDVTLTPVQMKKNRPGTILSVLCRPAQADELSEIMFCETTTLGIRRLAVTRQALPRRFEQLETPFGAVRVKVATLPDGTERATPEYEDCRRLAREAGASLRAVVEAARRAAGAVYVRGLIPPHTA